ncbi:MAG: tetratricopeptide repeat protein [SAR324 cluster bacterium]|nr:tetratricopeptide repeat protein [SAR324 cluster bacterium]
MSGSLVDLWKDAIQTSPHKSRPLHNLGYSYAQQKHDSAAIIYVQKALQMNPASVHSQITLAQYYIRNQQYVQSIAEYQELFRLEKRYPHWDWGEIGFQAYYELGQLFTQLKRWQEALPLLQEALSRHQEKLEIHELLGKV